MSPVNNVPSAASQRAIDPAVCPGTCRTSKATIPEVDDVPLAEEPRRLRGGCPPSGHVEPLSGQRRDHELRGLIAEPADLVLQTRTEVLTPECEPVGHTDPVGIGRVTPAFVEGVQPACVVEMVVRGNRDDPSVVDERSQLRAQVTDPVAGIHDEVTVSPAYVPHVRFEERVEMSFHEQRDVLGDPSRTEPPLGDGQLVHRRSVKKTDDGAGRKQWTDTIEALYEPTFGIATMSPSSISGIG